MDSNIFIVVSVANCKAENILYKRDCCTHGVIDLCLHYYKNHKKIPVKDVPRIILHETINFSTHTADSASLSRAAELAKLCPLPEPEGMSACTEPLLDCVLNGKLPPDDSFTICKWLGLGTPAMAPLLAKTLADLACGVPLTLTDSLT